MSQGRDSLSEEISKWKILIQQNEEFLEIAFFKIFVKFENYMTSLIVSYAIGEIESDDKMLRRLEFSDISHFKKTVGLNYLDTGIKTKELVDQLFGKENYFSFFFNSTDNEFYEKMKCLRNYIAHESEESKQKYVKKTLNDEIFIEPNTFLKKAYSRKDHTLNYTKFIELVEKYANIFDYNKT